MKAYFPDVYDTSRTLVQSFYCAFSRAQKRWLKQWTTFNDDITSSQDLKRTNYKIF